MTLREAAARITALEALLKYLFAAFGITPCTAADAIEAAADDGAVYEALVACMGSDFTVVRFSRFLNQNCRLWNGYRQLILGAQGDLERRMAWRAAMSAIGHSEPAALG
jgi:hypothetical protein